MDNSKRGLLLFSIAALFTQTHSLAYDEHWLAGPTTIERDVPSAKRAVDIYCYTGTSKKLFALWQTVQFHIKIQNDEFQQYFGSSPEEVYKEYTKDNVGRSGVQKTVSVSLFAPTCMAVKTKERHTIELQVLRVDIWRVLLMASGIILISLSRALSRNTLFFYLCGIFVGVFASFMVLVYYISKPLPRKNLIYGILIMIMIFDHNLIQENIHTVVMTYPTFTFWYILVVSFVSFLVCYWIGIEPPKNKKSKNIVMWILQAVGVLMIFFSSEYEEASAAVIIAMLAAKYFP
ncbi:unnamed protein product [Arctia plantaginis]|uniref:Uncharacterized protein n=1 Tax=Arctia plantaginis TaxID=874455 RepID=A0A8S0ZXE0_ARCPL|nr:unnamed protein product [Arctia plantaginis]